MSLSAYAAGSVTYSAESSKFIFESGTDTAPTDLFTEYKGLMPGDSVKQEITVKNVSSYGIKVQLYIRSKGADTESEEFLSKLHLTVAKSEDNDMVYMFDAAADQTGGMTDWVFLGTLYSGGEVNLVLNLDIPLDLDNKYQDAIGNIDWEFKAEELPIEPDDPKPPQTGDNSIISVVVVIGSVSALGGLLFIRKRKFL